MSMPRHQSLHRLVPNNEVMSWLVTADEAVVAAAVAAAATTLLLVAQLAIATGRSNRSGVLIDELRPWAAAALAADDQGLVVRR